MTGPTEVGEDLRGSDYGKSAEAGAAEPRRQYVARGTSRTHTSPSRILRYDFFGRPLGRKLDPNRFAFSARLWSSIPVAPTKLVNYRQFS